MSLQVNFFQVLRMFAFGLKKVQHCLPFSLGFIQPQVYSIHLARVPVAGASTTPGNFRPHRQLHIEMGIPWTTDQTISQQLNVAQTGSAMMSLPLRTTSVSASYFLIYHSWQFHQIILFNKLTTFVIIVEQVEQIYLFGSLIA